MPVMRTSGGVNWDAVNAAIKAKLRDLVNSAAKPTIGEAIEEWRRPKTPPGPTIRPPTPYEKYVQPVADPVLNTARKAAGFALGETEEEQAQNSVLALMQPMEVAGLGRIARKLDAPLWTLLKRKTGGGYQWRDPVKERILAAIREGQGLGQGWLEGRQRLGEAIGPLGPNSSEDMAKKYLRGFAAVSPNQQALNNSGEAASALALYMRRQPFTMDTLGSRGVGNRGAKIPNLRIAYTDTAHPLMSGTHRGKVDDFADLLVGGKGNPGDLHHTWVLGGNERDFSDALPGVKEFIAKDQNLPKVKSPTTGRLIDPVNNEQAYRTMSDATQSVLDYAGSNFPDFWEGIRKVRGMWRNDAPYPVLEKWQMLRPGGMSSPNLIEDAIRAQKTVKGAPYAWVKGHPYGDWGYEAGSGLWTPHESVDPLSFIR